MSAMTPARPPAALRRRLIDVIEGEDEKWIVLTCDDCHGLFDIPKAGRRGHAIPTLCEECRVVRRHERQARYKRARREQGLPV